MHVGKYILSSFLLISLLLISFCFNTFASDDGVTIKINVVSPPAPPAPPPTGGGGGGGGGWIPPPPVTKAILQGKAYPNTEVVVLKDGKVSTMVTTDSLANFKVEFSNITPGVYTFTLWANDQKGRKSLNFSFTTNVAEGMITTVTGIFVPPTIELEKDTLRKGETLNILGQTVPQSEVNVSVKSQEFNGKINADEQGFWDYPLDTTSLDEGTHNARAKAISPDGWESIHSQVLSFNLGRALMPGEEELCPQADFNKDGKTNLVDFSILLYWWGKSNACVDQNKNGIVDLADFSVMLYHWSG